MTQKSPQPLGLVALVVLLLTAAILVVAYLWPDEALAAADTRVVLQRIATEVSRLDLGLGRNDCTPRSWLVLKRLWVAGHNDAQMITVNNAGTCHTVVRVHEGGVDWLVDGQIANLVRVDPAHHRAGRYDLNWQGCRSPSGRSR